MNSDKFQIAVVVVTIVFICTSCELGYVSQEPTYAPVERPQQPSTVHVWVNDGWAYNRQSRSYVQRNGYWAMPRSGRAYNQGYWRKSRRGSVWVNGHW
jgi:hypothetical protein